MSQVPRQTRELRLAVAFVNTLHWLVEPLDRLSPAVAAELATRHGHPALAAGLAQADLDPLRTLRDGLYRVFVEPESVGKVAALDAVLASAHATARADSEFGIIAVVADNPVRRLGALCADALARALADGGADRLGICDARPCRRGYVDLTRAARQRFCCGTCTDRVAAAAYRRRKKISLN